MKMLFIILTAAILSGCFFGTPVEKTVTPTIRAIGVPDSADVVSVSLLVTDSEGVVVSDTTYSTLPPVD